MSPRFHQLLESSFFIIAELESGVLKGMSGTYKDHAGYFVDEEEADPFDTAFPPKEKLKLPGQLF